jgi:hypothetical protein
LLGYPQWPYRPTKVRLGINRPMKRCILLFWQVFKMRQPFEKQNFKGGKDSPAALLLRTHPSNERRTGTVAASSRGCKRLRKTMDEPKRTPSSRIISHVPFLAPPSLDAAWHT